MKQYFFNKRLFLVAASLVLCNQLNAMQRNWSNDFMTEGELDRAIFHIAQSLLQVTIESSANNPATEHNEEMATENKNLSIKKRKRDDANDKLNKEQQRKQRPTASSYIQGAWGDLSDDICDTVRTEIRYIFDPDSQQPTDSPLKIKNNATSIELFNRIDSILDPLMLAVQQDNEEMISSLILNHALYELTMDPLMFAIQQGNLEMVKLLIDTDAVNVNQQNEHGWTALDYAADLGLNEICELLRTKFASRNT